MATSENIKDVKGVADVVADGISSPTPASPAPASSNNARRQAFLRSASVPTLESTPPRLRPRWLHADGKSWNPYGPGDSERIEKGWQAWRDSDQKDAANAAAAFAAPQLPDADPTQPLPAWRVPVGEDRLFEVDVRSSPASPSPSSSSSSSSPAVTPGMHPVFWKGPRVEVRRGEWFFESTRLAPCQAELSQELEELYNQVRPWTSAYAEELRASASIGAEGEEKLICQLKSVKHSYVIFSGSHLARIYQDGMSTRLAKTILTAWAGEHGGGTVVVRGYDQMQNLVKARRGDVIRRKRAKQQSAAAGGASQTGTPKKGTKPLGSDTPQRAESPRPDQEPATSKTEKAAEAAVEEAKQNDEAASSSTDIWSSLTAKFGSWSSTTKAQQDVVAASFKEAQRRTQDLLATEGDGEVATDEEEDDDDEEEELAKERAADNEEVELVLCWHGIGQKLAEDWKTLEFSLAINAFKALIRKRASAAAPSSVGGPGFPQLTKGKRLALIPINWRATLNDFKPKRRPNDDGEEDEEHLDNEVELEDIFGASDSIPLARQITKTVLLDVPLYLSHHKTEVLRRCIAETNRAYALFCQRNPFFAQQNGGRGGKVSLICHSLGCALACDVLSRQPTFVPRDLGPGDVMGYDHLAFDVHNLYFCGSPAALFFYLESRQLIARRGRELAGNSRAADQEKQAPKDDASLSRPAWGCLAVDRIWNVINATDPIGTYLGGCVDRHYAREKATSVPMDRVVNAILATLPGAKAMPQTQTGAAVASGAKTNAATDGVPASSSTASIFGSWSRSATPQGTRPAAGGGASSPPDPPADLGEMPISDRDRSANKRKSLLGKDGLVDAASLSSRKAQQWATKFAQAKAAKNASAVGEPTVTTGAVEAVAEATKEVAVGVGEDGGDGKTSYPPPPAVEASPNDEQVVKEVAEAMGEETKLPVEEQEVAAVKGGDVAAAATAATDGAAASKQEPAKEGAQEDAKADTAATTNMSSQRRDRARRRFLALNPLGRIDYVLPKAAPSMLVPAAMLEYVSMLQAHANYWTNETFADFVLATSALGDGEEEEEDYDDGKWEKSWEKARRNLLGDEDEEGKRK